MRRRRRRRILMIIMMRRLRILVIISNPSSTKQQPAEMGVMDPNRYGMRQYYIDKQHPHPPLHPNYTPNEICRRRILHHKRGWSVSYGIFLWG